MTELTAMAIFVGEIAEPGGIVTAKVKHVVRLPPRIDRTCQRCGCQQPVTPGRSLQPGELLHTSAARPVLTIDRIVRSR
jgi:hypothetical protein